MPGVPADLSPQEASDMLHKLLTESTRIKAVLARNGYPQTGIKQPAAWVVGKLRSGDAGRLMVCPDTGCDDFAIVFEPGKASSVKYGDERVLTAPENSGFQSVLTFYYGDHLVALFDAPERLTSPEIPALP
jgi:hypothetical protein